ncbi:uncharacterized protein PG986_013430 [Apiospora aurea]|uniref:Secreted protein n=1 Tax=Apiospora aurea TaxID=335848 RepID=A0ABR1PVJ4_9PEZI
MYVGYLIRLDLLSNQTLGRRKSPSKHARLALVLVLVLLAFHPSNGPPPSQRHRRPSHVYEYFVPSKGLSSH